MSARAPRAITCRCKWEAMRRGYWFPNGSAALHGSVRLHVCRPSLMDWDRQTVRASDFRSMEVSFSGPSGDAAPARKADRGARALRGHLPREGSHNQIIGFWW
jgi:hypothetical protein